MYQVSCKSGGTYYFEVKADNIIRVVYTMESDCDQPSCMIENYAEACEIKTENTDEYYKLSTSKVQMVFHKNTEHISWYRRQNRELLLQEGKKELTKKEVKRYRIKGDKAIIQRVKTVDGERNFIQNLETVEDGYAYRGKLTFCFQEEEGIYGLGQGEEGIYNYRGHNQYLYQHNMRIPMPCFVSSNAYGILADCSSLMTFQDEVGEAYFFLDSVKQMDYYFVAGECMDDIVGGFRKLTGAAQMLPKWAFGYIQSKEAYLTQEELVETVAKYRQIGIPLDGIVQDWLTWEEGKWGNKRVDKTRYPNLPDAMKRIQDMHAHTMVSVWPNINQGCEDYEEMLEADELLLDLSTYNAFSEKGRELYFQQAKRELFDGGFDAWWCDSTEPFSGPDWNGEARREPWERYSIVGEEHKKYLGEERANLYALYHAKGIYENQRKATEKKRVLNLTRSGYPSIQKYGAVLWSGDTCATWQNFKIQITEGLNMALSGIPYWTLDIGAFFTVKKQWQNRGCNCNQDATMKWFWQGDYEEGVADLGYRELYTRWLQMGTFLPMFRSHGTDTPREIWNFGEKGSMFYDAIERFIKLRYTFMPYIYSLAWQVHKENGTMLRSLLFDYAKDKRARENHEQFMFGSSILVCPVTEPMYFEKNSTPIEKKKTWKCYLPIGNDWYDYWSNKKYEGGQEIEAEAGIDKIPLFIKAGSILPVTEGIQYTGEKAAVKLLVYKGGDASCVLYEDAGDGYGFEQGEYAEREIVWKEKEGELQIGAPKGDKQFFEQKTYEIEYIG